MRSQEDLSAKSEAVEFFFEICQMSKSMQMGGRFNFEQISNLHLVDILAETLNLYPPTLTTLRAEILGEPNPYESDPTLEDLMKVHEKYEVRKVDWLKINALEILMNLLQFAPGVNMR